MIRAATFNVENLFDRPKIINLASSEKSATLLDAVRTLTKELGRSTYDTAVIEALLAELKGYVTIRVDRGKFFAGRSTTKLRAKSASDWEGGVEFVRSRFDDQQRQNTATLIKALRADVLCLVEVEGRTTLGDFMVEFFTPKQRLGRNMLIDSPIDPRGIDLAVAWRDADLGTIRSNAYDSRVVSGRQRTVWSRDCLEVELKIAGGRSLWVLANHFKSKFGGDTPDSVAKRRAQGERLSEILTTRYDLAQDLVLVMGDLNDTPDSDPIAPVYGTPGLHDVFDVVNHPVDDRWTYYYAAAPVAQRRTQIDYVFVSEALRPLVSGVKVERRGMTAVAQGRVPGVSSLAGIDSWRTAASDHAAIIVDINQLDFAD